jgi:hypothetical protein
MTMMKANLTALGSALALTAALALPGQADAQNGDIRQFTVGLGVAELPQEGYLGFACGRNGANPEPEISGWQAYGECPADERGLHEVAFQYDDSEVLFDDLEGTAIAGHPVLISLLFTDDGVVDGVRVFTDPNARPYNKRRARVLSRKVKARFGMDGWECVNAEPGDGEAEVGGVFTKERCTTDLGNRTIDLFTQFYRVWGADGEEIINETQFEIWAKP